MKKKYKVMAKHTDMTTYRLNQPKDRFSELLKTLYRHMTNSPDLVLASPEYFMEM